MTLYARIDSIPSDPALFEPWADEDYFSNTSYILENEQIPKYVFAGLVHFLGGVERARTLVQQYLTALNSRLEANSHDQIEIDKITGSDVVAQPHKLLYAWDGDVDTFSEMNRVSFILSTFKAGLSSSDPSTRIIASAFGLFIAMVLVNDRLASAGGTAAAVFEADRVANSSYDPLLYFTRHIMSSKPDALRFPDEAERLMTQADASSIVIGDPLKSSTRNLLRELRRYEASYTGGSSVPTASIPVAFFGAVGLPMPGAGGAGVSTPGLPAPSAPAVIGGVGGASMLPPPPGAPSGSGPVGMPPPPGAGAPVGVPAPMPSGIGMPPSPTSAPVGMPTPSAPVGMPSAPSATRSPMSRSSSGPSATYAGLLSDVSRATPLVNKLARILSIPARDVYDFLHVLDQLQESYENGLLEVVDRMKEQR